MSNTQSTPKPAAIDHVIEISLIAGFTIIGIPLAIFIASGLLLHGA